MPIKRVQKKLDWSPEDRARHRAIRESVKDKPSIEQLVARGELPGQPMSLGAYLNLRCSSASFASCVRKPIKSR